MAYCQFLPVPAIAVKEYDARFCLGIRFSAEGSGVQKNEDLILAISRVYT